MEYWYKDAFRTTDEYVSLIAVITNASLTSNLNFQWKYYYPDGTQYGSTLDWPNAFSRDWEWGWGEWGYLISGNSMAYTPGKYKVRFYVNGDRKATHSFVVGWDFTQHFMCRDYDASWQPIGQTNVFSPTDQKAVALHHFEYRAQGLDVKTEFFGPGGTLYSSSEDSFTDDLGPNEWYDWSRHASWIWISGTPAQYMCGTWTVKFYVKNPSSGGWEQKYTDYFRIEEHTAPTMGSISVSPVSPIETQVITLAASASDDNHLDRIDLYWQEDGGPVQTQSWTAINAASRSVSYSIGAKVAGAVITFWRKPGTNQEIARRASIGRLRSSQRR